MIQIAVTSVFVDDQEKALAFYTDVVGFTKRQDIPLGGEHRWLTVVSSTEKGAVELLLEPNDHPAAKAYQAAIYDDGIPATMLTTDDVRGEYDRMSALGVRFSQVPTPMGPNVIATFDDTCGNLISLAQVG
jgi:predicted enzyme related to lactoylglutathione lyase